MSDNLIRFPIRVIDPEGASERESRVQAAQATAALLGDAHRQIIGAEFRVQVAAARLTRDGSTDQALDELGRAQVALDDARLFARDAWLAYGHALGVVERESP